MTILSGFLACCLTLLTIGAPLSKLFYVVKMKCTDCLPFPMIVMSFFVSSLWFLYGLIEEDVYMTVIAFFYSYKKLIHLIILRNCLEKLFLQ